MDPNVTLCAGQRAAGCPADRAWDAIVVGAGVGGAAAALGLARRLGATGNILLVERSAWPRTKVCGCCLNAAAVASLDRLGMLGALRLAGAIALHSVRIQRGHRARTLRLEPGLGLPRESLDAALVDAAVRSGVVFVPECRAEVLPIHGPSLAAHDDRVHGPRRVLLHQSDRSDIHETSLVIAADGLGGSSLDQLPEFRPEAALASWMGLGATIDHAGGLPAGQIRMCIGDHGYVGVVRLTDATITIGAAADPAWVRSVGGPAPAVREILCSAGEEWSSSVPACKFRGTPALTRHRRRVAQPGLIVLGDAAGYVEPFTGEGMAWALECAREASTIAADALLGEHSFGYPEAARWQTWLQLHARRRQRWCRCVRAVLHRPALADAAMVAMCLRPVRSGVESALAGWPRTLPGSQPLREHPETSGVRA